MSEDTSRLGRARRMAGQARDRVTDATGALTGKALEDSIREYTELYSQVLIGLSDDLVKETKKSSATATELEKISKQLSILQDSLAAESEISSDLAVEIERIAAQLTKLNGERETWSRRPQMMALAALVVSGISIAGMVWMIVSG